jgi:Family of unknown function (DUF5709)
VDDDIDDNADTGVLDPEDTLDDRDAYDEGYSPPERAQYIDNIDEETFDSKLDREVPDVGDSDSDGLGDATDTDGELVDDEVGDRRAGRLVAADEGFGADTDEELRATDVGIDGGAASAEEAAVHVVNPDE